MIAAVESDVLVLRRRPDTVIRLTPVYADAFRGSIGTFASTGMLGVRSPASASDRIGCGVCGSSATRQSLTMPPGSSGTVPAAANVIARGPSRLEVFSVLHAGAAPLGACSLRADRSGKDGPQMSARSRPAQRRVDDADDDHAPVGSPDCRQPRRPSERGEAQKQARRRAHRGAPAPAAGGAGNGAQASRTEAVP